MTNRWFVICPLLFILFCLLANSWLTPLVKAAENASSGADVEPISWRLSISADYLGIGNANSTLTNARNTSNECSQLNFLNGGSNRSCSVSEKAYGAKGFRVGLLREYDGIKFGPSIGYLSGGPGVGSMNVRLNGIINNVGIVSSANTLRLLGEVSKTWPLMGAFNVRLGAGLGAAVEDATVVGSGFNSSEGFAEYSSMGWFTWELSPALTYKKLSLGLRYMGFARGSQVPWNTMGGFLGVDF